jgi:flagellar L-ring protein precursor FlgH
MKNYCLIISLVFFLTGCGSMLEKVSNIGKPPLISEIQNPKDAPGYQSVTMPMPAASQGKERTNSLWETGSRAFFKDQRANKVGDIVTVVIDIDQKESIEMSPNIQRKSVGNTIVNNALGFEKKAEKFFPKKQHDAGATNSKWLDFTSNPQFSGTAKYDVSDKIKFKIAATIIQILPNGNMVVQGRQEMRLVNEVREIQMKGIIRPEDVSATNTIPSDKVAELRLSYGGRGELTDAQARPWGQQALDAVMPF